MTWPVEHVSRSITATPAEVVALAGDYAGIHYDGGRWVTDDDEFAQACSRHTRFVRVQ